MYKNILFDVDGTLLPMDVHEFVKYYFGSLCEKMIPVLKNRTESAYRFYYGRAWRNG